MNKRTTQFSLAYVALFDADSGAYLGTLDRSTMLEVPGAAREGVDTMGGADQWVSDVRSGRRSGEGKITANECPAWVMALGLGGRVATSAASVGSVGSVGGPTGSSVPDALTVAVSGTPVDAVIEVEVTKEASSPSPAEVTLRVRGRGKPYEITGVEVGTGATIVARLGISVELTASQTLTLGDLGHFTITAPHGSRESVQVGNDANDVFVRIVGRSVGQNATDFTGELIIHRAWVNGFTPKFEDNAATSGMELDFKVVANPGGLALEVNQDQPAA